MDDIKKVMWWIFAATSLLHLYVLVRSIHYLLRYHCAPPYSRGVLVTALISALMCASAFLAWWTIWKKMRVARFWALIASGTSVLIFLRAFLFPSGPLWDRHWGALVIGVVGIVVFSRIDSPQSTTTTAAEHGSEAT
jgi:hypothetical protein